MLRQVKIVPGVEIEVAPARRAKGHSTAKTIAVSQAECRFLLACMKNIGGMAEAIVHHPLPGQFIATWDRQHVVNRLVGWVENLRRLPPNLFVITPLDHAIITYAIEHNPYFAEMHDSDPRLTVAAIRQANALRVRVQAALNCRINRIPIGNRKRIVEAVRA